MEALDVAKNACICITALLVALSVPGVQSMQTAMAQQDEEDDIHSPGFDSDISSDSNPPMVRILNPSACSDPITSSGISTVTGVASDSGSGIRKVETFSHSFPFDESYPFRITAPSAFDDWSSWSMPVQIYENSTRILARATDNAGNENWDEVTVDFGRATDLRKVASSSASLNFAFVDPAFTYAAYGVGGFYEFYNKYHGTEVDELVGTDLDLLVAEISAYTNRSYYQPILERVRSAAPDSNVVVLTDMDVHEGVIFGPAGENLFRALFLLHNEYVSQQEYDNLKRFVHNGGTLVFIDSNNFYAEVHYDKDNCNVTLIKGHDWEYYGDFARPSVSERYLEENREWVGTNYMINSLWDPVQFSNVPFNYAHFEENYIANENVTILHDYGLLIGSGYDGPDWHMNATIAAYEKSYGEGTIIGLGIYGQRLAGDTQFLDFFDRVILSRALGNVYNVETEDSSHQVYWRMGSGQVSAIMPDPAAKKLVVTIEGNSEDDMLRMSLPRTLIDISDDTISSDQFQTIGHGEEGQVTVPSYDVTASKATFVLVATSGDGIAEQVGGELVVQEIDHERIIEVPLKAGTTKVEIYGTNVTPELGLIMPAILIVAIGIAGLVLMTRFIPKRPLI